MSPRATRESPLEENRPDMEIVYFTITAIILYVLCDWLLRRLESMAGRVFEHRSLIFFAMLLSSALISFALIRQLFAV